MNTSGNVELQNKARRITDEEFRPYISKLFLEHFGNTYDHYNNIGDTWRVTHTYSFAAQAQLIQHARLFIMTLDTKDKDNTNLTMLFCLAHMMAKYLSAYVKHSPLFKGDRKAAKKFIAEQLYNEFWYIKNLEAKKDDKRSGRKAYKKKHNREKKLESLYEESINYIAQHKVVMRSRRVKG